MNLGDEETIQKLYKEAWEHADKTFGERFMVARAFIGGAVWQKKNPHLELEKASYAELKKYADDHEKK